MSNSLLDTCRPPRGGADDDRTLARHRLDIWNGLLLAPHLDEPLRVGGLHDGHRAYLPWHRQRVFRAA